MKTREALPLRKLFEAYEVKKLRGKSGGCAAQFYTAIHHFEEFLKRPPTTDDLFDDRVSAFMHSLIERCGIVVETAVSYVKKLLALWRFGCRQRIVELWPEMQLLKPPEREPIAWTRAEVHAKFKALCAQDGYIGDIPERIFWPALECMFWDSAERLGAILMVRVEDVNLVGRYVLCRAETRKGKLRDRGFPIHEQTAEFVRLLLAEGGKRRMLFEVPFGEQTLRDKYKQILKGAGLPHDRRHLFHCNRKTVASWFEALGHDAMKLLDHSTRAVTRRYLAPQVVKSVQPADVLWRPGDAE